MFCPKCGAILESDAKFCPTCGTPIVDTDNAAAPAAPAAPEAPVYAEASVQRPAPKNLKEFVLQFCDVKTRKEIKAAWIILYVAAGISLAYALMMKIPPIDAVILALIATWMMLTYSPASAIVALVFAVGEFVLTLATTGTVGGWLVIIAAVFAVIYIFKANKHYKNYLATGELPPQDAA